MPYGGQWTNTIILVFKKYKTKWKQNNKQYKHKYADNFLIVLHGGLLKAQNKWKKSQKMVIYIL